MRAFTWLAHSPTAPLDKLIDALAACDQPAARHLPRVPTPIGALSS
jgi:hypothetical protein